MFNKLLGLQIMAAWQFKVCLVPRLWAERNNFDIALLHDDEGSIDCAQAWSETTDIAPIENAISQFFPPSKSWHEDLLSWGNEKATDVQLWQENGQIEDLEIRIDMRENIEQNSNTICALASVTSCVTFLPEFEKFMVPVQSELVAYAMQSRSAKWATLLGSNV